MCAAVLDCSHLLLIVAIGIAHAMLARHCKAHPTMLCIHLFIIITMYCMYSVSIWHPRPMHCLPWAIYLWTTLVYIIYTNYSINI